VWENQRPVVVEDVAAERRFPKLMSVLRESGVRSYCTVPLTSALRRLGAMSFGSVQKRIFQETEINFRQQVARQVAVAVDNVLHEESARQAQQQLARERDRVRLLLEVNNAVVSHLTLDELFPVVSACLRRVVQHDGSALVLFDEAARRFRVHLLRFAKNESVIEEGQLESACCGANSPSTIAVNNRKPALFREADLKKLCSESEAARGLIAHGVKTFCAIPLLSHDRALGALNVGRLSADEFSPDDVELLSEVAKQIAIAVENAQAYRELAELKDKLAKEKLYREEEVRTEHNFGEIIGNSPVLRKVLNEVETVAPTSSTVLIHGETGTGKELIARALHDLSPRRDRTFVKLNCAAIPTWRVNCSATRKARSPVRSRSALAGSNWRTAARCSSMRSATFRSNFSRSCSAPCRNRNSSAWAARGPFAWTCGWSGRRIVTSRQWSPTANSAATSFIA
jgi:formate hydrogenlyase transcriptional activator